MFLNYKTSQWARSKALNSTICHTRSRAGKRIKNERIINRNGDVVAIPHMPSYVWRTARTALKTYKSRAVVVVVAVVLFIIMLILKPRARNVACVGSWSLALRYFLGLRERIICRHSSGRVHVEQSTQLHSSTAIYLSARFCCARIASLFASFIQKPVIFLPYSVCHFFHFELPVETGVSV